MANVSFQSYKFLKSFNHDNQNWSVFKERLEQWFVAKGFEIEEGTSKDTHRAILLTSLSANTLKLARELALPKEITSLEYDSIVKLLDDHFGSTICGLVERNRFYTSTQQPTERLAEWAARVRGLAVNCAFPASCLNELLRDRFVVGMIPGPEQDKLLTMDMVELTLDKALETAETLHSVLLAGGRIGQAAGAVTCLVCGFFGHRVEACKFKSYMCGKCGERGHLWRMCPIKFTYTVNMSRPKWMMSVTMVYMVWYRGIFVIFPPRS